MVPHMWVLNRSRDLVIAIDQRTNIVVFILAFEKVPRFIPEHKSLAEWTRKQRGYMRDNKISAERNEHLLSIDFYFELQSTKYERRWDEML
jgi:hypothetical protein